MRLSLGLGNVLFITFASMLGIMAVIGLSRILASRNVPVLGTVGNFVDNAWKNAA